MKKILFSFIVALFVILFRAQNVVAISDPLSVPNNHFGIHISDMSDLKDAALLVNGNGGSWGYVTIVIRDDDMNILKWQEIFDEMRKLEIIPIVRLATHQKDSGWEKPSTEDATKWAEFLSQLNWVVKNRYVILFNEPNHAKEWGGQINPEEYARIVRTFHQVLKQKSDDFFIISAGFDMAAAKSLNTMDALVFFDKMYQHDKEVFKFFDGWSSHSYPNPGFISDPLDVGRKSIRSFLGEVKHNENLGLKSNIPIFITETGWIHKEGKINVNEAPGEEKVAEYFKYAFENVWNHPQVVSATPFILNYPNPPFDHFSWKKADGLFYSQYGVVKQLPKVKGEPVQENLIEFIDDTIPTSLVADSLYERVLKIKNAGQKIWYEGDLSVDINSEFDNYDIVADSIQYTKAGAETSLKIIFNTPDQKGVKKFSIQFLYKGKPIGEPIKREIAILAPMSLQMSAPLSLKLVPHESDDTTLLIYEDEVHLIKSIENINFRKGKAKIKELHNVIPGKEYRFVITKPGFLPSQVEATLEDATDIIFPPLAPVDYDRNGKFDQQDFFSFLLNPLILFKLVFPF